jgi:uncharacterized protein (DUF983 family)
METKRCPGCGKTKPVREFTATDPYCKVCRKEINVVQYGNRRRGYKLEDAFEPKL